MIFFRRVSVHTNSTLFKNQQFSTWRRFSDFLGLHEKLMFKYIKFGYIIPPAPEKHAMETAKIKMGNLPNEETQTNNEFLESRRLALERFISRIARHHYLRRDTDFIAFLEADKDLPKANTTSSLSSAGMMRLINKFGETVNKITYKMDENDPWFSEKVTDIEKTDFFIQKLFSLSKLLQVSRKDLFLITGSIAKSINGMSGHEEHTGLSKKFSQLASVLDKIEILRSGQSFSDYVNFSEKLKDHVAYSDAIKTILHERVKIFQNWQYSQNQLVKKRETKSKLESSHPLSHDDPICIEYDEVNF